MILPKCWIARIQKYWDFAIPTDIPESSSEFSVTFDSPEVKDAVKAMEEALNTESSIVQPTDIPENEALSDYLGTYNVTGTPGELTLLSPNKIDSLGVDAVAYHYDEDAGTWSKIEDAQIIDGYVWGTVASFSPIAVFTIRLDDYTMDKIYNLNLPTYVANGIPVVISVNEEGKTVATNAYGKVTELKPNTFVVAGSLDHDLEYTSLVVKPGAQIRSVRAGSCQSGDAETPLKVGKAKVIIEGIDNKTFGVSGSYGAVRTEEVEITIKDSTIDFCGAGESIANKIDANADDKNNCSMASKAWVKKATIVLDNSYVDIAYAGGNCGYMYGNDVSIELKNGSGAQWLIAGGSNGATGKGKFSMSDSKVKFAQSTNRGPVGYAEEYVENSEVEYLFPTGDSTDTSVTGTIDKVDVTVKGGKINLYPGTNGGVKITRADAARIVDSLVITEDTEVAYKDDADTIFAGMITTR